ncbi:MAG: LLM class flavin-dependent oxidoreductase [Myxococcales bacterium]|nr:LLM class flavin-dependent oxidoreductase [Myxococcales bacterium]HIK84079.1 LLM class flavin-dependent oxidoreductase [Myxococcales bacterium]
MYASVLLVGWGWTSEQYQKGWQEVEELGYHACYIGDDLFAHQADADVGTFEPWTMLGAMAATTSRMKIGSMVSPAGRRHPGLFAKITSTADQLSNGRLIVGMGAGNAPEQQKSLNQPFRKPLERVAMLSEELDILKSMWTEGRTDYVGEHYAIKGGICEPKPISNPHPEILLGVLGRAMIKVAGRHADRVNCLTADQDRVKIICEDIKKEALTNGRDPSAILFSRLATILFTDEVVTDTNRRGIIEARARKIGKDPEILRQEIEDHLVSYVGHPDRCAEWVRRSTSDIGINEIVICIDTVDTSSYEHTMAGLRTFARNVLPSL